MSRYKNAHKNKLSKQKKNSKFGSIPEAIESPLISINENEIMDDMLNSNDTSTKDSSSDKRKSVKSEKDESCDDSLNLEEKTENLIEHHREPRRKNSKAKDISKSVQFNTEQENGSGKGNIGKKEGVSLFDNIKTKISIKSVATQKEYREGDCSKSERSSVGSTSMKNNGKEKKDGNNHDNKQNFHRKVASFSNKRSNVSKIKEKGLDEQLEKQCFGKCHKSTCFYQFTGFNKTTLKLCFVSIAYVVIYIPWFVFQVSVYFEPTEERKIIHKFNYLLFTYFPFAGCAINPVIYAFVDPKFRSQSMALFQ